MQVGFEKKGGLGVFAVDERSPKMFPDYCCLVLLVSCLGGMHKIFSGELSKAWMGWNWLGWEQTKLDWMESFPNG